MAAAADAGHHLTFHELLSELNPLQYLPVIGTIYRSVTGDTIPDSVRIIGSMVVSGLIGGPIGIATNVAALAVERVTGLDPEKIGHDILASIGIGNDEPASVAAPAVAASPVPPQAALAQASPISAPVAWSPSQLMAYGVTTTASGTLTRGDLQGSDVLNDLELMRHGAQFAAAPSSAG